MSAAFRVVRFENWVNPVFDETLEQTDGVSLTRLRFADDRAANLAVLAGAHALHISPARDELPGEWFVTADLLAMCPSLLLVSSGGAGYDTIDVPACTAAGVTVANQTGGNAVSVAEHTLGLLLSVWHRIAESDRALRGEVRGFSREDLVGTELAGKTIGLVGIGNIGRRVAALAAAFGMKAIATDPYLSRDEIESRGAAPVSFEALLETADVVSLHCPRLPTTMRMMDAKAFGRMKPGAVFLSTARGGIHDEAALHEALSSGKLFGAGLDVWDVEPPPVGHPLFSHPRVVGTFHTAGVTGEARRNVASIAAAQIAGFAAGEKPPRLINPEVWPTVRTRFQQTFGRLPAA